METNEMFLLKDVIDNIFPVFIGTVPICENVKNIFSLPVAVLETTKDINLVSKIELNETLQFFTTTDNNSTSIQIDPIIKITNTVCIKPLKLLQNTVNTKEYSFNTLHEMLENNKKYRYKTKIFYLSSFNIHILDEIQNFKSFKSEMKNKISNLINIKIEDLYIDIENPYYTFSKDNLKPDANTYINISYIQAVYELCQLL